MSVARQQDAMALAEDLDEFLRNYYRDAIGELAQRYPQEQQSLRVSWRDLHRFGPGIVDDLEHEPALVQEALDAALANFDIPIDVDLSGATVRIHDVPDVETITVGEFSPSDRRGTWVAVEGQVGKRTAVKPDPQIAVFECQRCGTPHHIDQPTDDLQEPHECQSCERQGPFVVDFNNSEFEDVQWVKLKQPPDVAQGSSEAWLEVVLRDDLVKTVESGDRVTITGTLTMVNEDGDFDVFLDTAAADVHDTDFADIEIDAETKAELEAIENPIETLRESLAVRVYGYETVKEAIILQLVSGVRVEFPDGSARRGTINVLEIGDPGTVKSSLLGAAAEVAPRSVYTSGKGASKAGMTAAAVRDDFGDAEWSLDAGALVVANGGLACVDEIDKVPDDVVSSLHDALSTGQVHVNKAGINTTLQARTSVLAAGNPSRGRFDHYEDLNEQVDLGPTLLSRFDLIFKLRDVPDEDQDTAIADHVTRTQHLAKRAMKTDATLADEEAAAVEPELDRETMRQYIAHARTIVPIFADDSVREKLRDEHVRLRQVNGTDEDATVPVTHRKLEGAYRLAEASAKARLSETIEMGDVERALRLIGRSLRDWGQNEDGEFDADVTEADTTASQRDRLVGMDELLAEMQAEADGRRVDADEFIAVATDEFGVSAKQVEHDIEKLKQHAEVIGDVPGEIRSI